VAGALFAMLPLVENAVRPSIVIKASNANSHEVVIELLQNCAPVPPQLADNFFEGRQQADDTARIGALAAKALAEAHDGHTAFEPVPHGSRLTIVMKRRS